MLESTTPAPQTPAVTPGTATAATWSTPDFTVVETGMEVTAYYLNDL
jgi:coenzyme PQQ precursor peptide PqqA